MFALATNRKIPLDKALERRIALKVDFALPDRAQRREIWQRLSPPKLPLARDADLDELRAAELTGGEIKNIILNAATLALQRAACGMVTHAELRQAVTLEQSGRWRRSGSSPIGFG
jgi:ATP-dependent 26S proteasome regulatory subunit